MQTLEEEKSLKKEFLGGDSNPGQIDDYHLMRLFCLSIYIRNITYWTTVIQRIKKNVSSSSVHPNGPLVVLVRYFNSIC